MNNFTPIGNTRALHEIIFKIQVNTIVFRNDQLQEVGDILTIQPAGIHRHRPLQAAVANDEHAMHKNSFLILGKGCVTTCGRCQVNNHGAFFPGICAVVMMISALRTTSAIRSCCLRL